MAQLQRWKSIFKESSEMYKGDNYYDHLFSDKDAAREIEIYAENDSNIYKQSFLPIIQNIKRKIKSGKYDPNLAPKLWLYYVENAMKSYAREFDDPKRWMNLLSTKDRKILATKLSDYYYDRIIDGEY